MDQTGWVSKPVEMLIEATKLPQSIHLSHMWHIFFGVKSQQVSPHLWHYDCHSPTCRLKGVKNLKNVEIRGFFGVPSAHYQVTHDGRNPPSGGSAHPPIFGPSAPRPFPYCLIAAARPVGVLLLKTQGVDGKKIPRKTTVWMSKTLKIIGINYQ